MVLELFRLTFQSKVCLFCGRPSAPIPGGGALHELGMQVAAAPESQEWLWTHRERGMGQLCHLTGAIPFICGFALLIFTCFRFWCTLVSSKNTS